MKRSRLIACAASMALFCGIAYLARFHHEPAGSELAAPSSSIAKPSPPIPEATLSSELEAVTDTRSAGTVAAHGIERIVANGAYRAIAGSRQTLPGSQREIAIFEFESKHDWLRVERTFDSTNDHQLGAVAMRADRFIVQLADGADIDELNYLSAELGFASITPIGSSSLAQVALASFEHPSDLPNAIRDLRAYDQVVAFAEPDYLLFQADLIPNDPEFQWQWSLGVAQSIGGLRQNDINAPQGWEIAHSAPNTIVAVIDSGLRITHEDIRNNLWTNRGEVLDGADNDGNGYIDDIHGINAIDGGVDLVDGSGHGTAMSGAIAAQGNNALGIAGVAWQAQIMPLKFISEEGWGTTSGAITCILYAIQHGAHIINASWGGPGDSQSLRATLQQASDEGIVIFVAAGNEALNIDVLPSYPASYSEIENLISVAASTRNGQLAEFSNYGVATVDIAAPGYSILSLSSAADNAYEYSSGTSIATAIASGVGALLHATHGADGLPARLATTVQLKPHLRAFVSSAGIINLHRALAGATNSPANDDFSNATTLENALSAINGHLTYATEQANEPNPANYPNMRTLWYRLPSPLASIGIEANAANGDITLAVYQGSTLGNLQLRRSQEVSGQTAFLVNGLNPQAPAYLQASGPASSGAFVFRLFTQPANDDLEHAIELASDTFEVTANNRFATAEDDEAPLSPKAIGKTLWWTMEASQSGAFALSTFGSETDTIIGIYTHDTSQAPTLLATNDNFSTATYFSRATVSLEAGRRYLFCVDSAAGLGGPITLQGQYLSQPEISASIRDQTAAIGDSVEFRVEALGPPPLAYEWIKDGVAIPGESNSYYRIAYTTAADFGTYQVRVHSPENFVTSESFKLIEGSEPPEILHQPDFTVFRVGESGKLSVRAKGSAPLRYQWYRNGQAIVGEIGPDLVFGSAQTAHAGLYAVDVSNNVGQTKSALVRVTIVPAGELDLILRGKLGDQDFVRSLAYFKNQWIAAGMLGKVSASTDGYSWSAPVNRLQGVNANQLVSGNDRLLALLEDGRIGATTNGTAWTLSAPSPNSLGTHKIVWQNGVFAALTFEGRIFTSTNGQSWALRYSFPDETHTSVSLAAANGYLLAARSTDTSITFARSTDGVNWTSHSAADLGHFNYTGPSSRGLQSAADIFLLATSQGVWKSVDGRAWSKSNSSQVPSDSWKIGDDYYYVYDNQTLVKTKDFEQSDTVFRSESFLCFAYGAGKWVVGPHRGTLLQFSNPEAIDFPGYSDSELRAGLWEGITFAAGQFVAWGDGGIITSTTGSRWRQTYREPGGNAFYGVKGLVFANRAYHLGFAQGPSLDSLETIGDDRQTVRAFGDGYYVATNGGAIYTSINGLDWTPVDSEIREHINAVIHAGGRFVAVGREGYVAASDDGLVWTEQKLPHTGDLIDIAYDGQKYVVTTENLSLATSSNAVVWTLRPLALGVVDPMPCRIAYGDGKYVLMDARYAYLSTDLSNWKHIRHDFGEVLDIAYGKGAFVGVCSNGAIVQLGKVSELPPTLEIQNGAEQFARLGETVSLNIDLQQLDGDIADLSLYVDGILIASGIESMDTVDWTPNDIGNNELALVATDSHGNESQAGIRIKTNKPLDIQILNDLPALGYRAITRYRDAFYAIGNNNVVYRSSNLLDWDPIFKADRGSPLSFTAAADALVMASDEGLYVSNDLMHWRFHKVDPRISRYGIVAAGDLLFNEDSTGLNLLYSEGGRHWQPVPIEPSVGKQSARSILGNTPLGVAFHTNTDGEFLIWNSTKGWTRQTIAPGHSVYQLMQVGDRTLAILRLSAAPYTYHAFESSNFKDWKSVSELSGFINNRELIGKDGVYYYEAYDGAYRVSIDGANTWNRLSSYHKIHDAAKWNDLYFLLASNNLLYSLDGIVWDSIPIEAVYSGQLETFETGVAILGYDSSIQVYTGGDQIVSLIDGEFSADGYTGAVAHGHAGYIAIRDRSLLTSQDAIDWQVVPKPHQSGFAIAYGNNVYLLAGDFNSVFRSTDGETWEEIATPLDTDRIAFLSQPGLFISESGGRHYMTSPDGIAWTKHQRADTWHQYLNAVGNLAYMNIDGVYSTTDGVSWSAQPLLTNPQFIYFHNGTYLALSDLANGHALRSSDGVNWQELTLPNGLHPTAIRPASNGFTVSTQINNYSTIDGSAWTEIGYQSPLNEPQYPNAQAWYPAFGISAISDQDLELAAVSAVAGEYAIGDAISLQLTVSNRGLLPIDLQGLEVRARLSIDGQWSDRESSVLESIYLPEKSLQPGESWSYAAEVQLPNQANYGEYSILCWLNPSQRLPENMIANNFRETSGRVVNLPSRAVEVASTVGGTAIVAPGGRLHTKGAQISAIPQPAPGYVFETWSGLHSASRELTFTLAENTILTPTFTRVYAPRITTSGKGTVLVDPDLGVFQFDDRLTLAATPAAGWVFDKWSGDATGTDGAIELLVQRDLSIHAAFAQTFASYQEGIFTPEQLADPSISGPHSDPDQDGATNLQEFSAGSDPLDRSSRPIFEYVISNNQLRLKFSRNRFAKDVETHLQWSADLQAWTAEGIATQILDTTSAGVQLIEATLPITSPSAFLRVRHEQTPNP